MHYQFTNKAGHLGQWLSGKTSEGTTAQAQRVLVVDDELSICLFLTRVLKDWGYGVRHVGSADEAMEVMAAEPADILFCDVTMPVHDGLWLAEQVHSRWPGTAIIMATARDDPHTVQTSRKVGAVAYLTKPFHQHLLREALDRVSSR